MKLSVIMPTQGRASLNRAVRSLRGADEIVVVGDGYLPRVAGAMCIEGSTSGHKRGGRAAQLRNIGMHAASSDWIAFLDDDDEFVPGAVSIIKKSVGALRVPALCVFRMRMPCGALLWRRQEIALGNVGTPMLVCPRANFVDWPYQNCGDYGFAMRNRLTWEGGVVWFSELVCQVRPDAYAARLRAAVPPSGLKRAPVPPPPRPPPAAARATLGRRRMFRG